MTHEQALALSADLAAGAWPHTVNVGVHDGMNPPVQCSVNVLMPRRLNGGLAEAIKALEEIGERHDLVLHTAFADHGLTYSTRSAADEFRRRLT